MAIPSSAFVRLSKTCKCTSKSKAGARPSEATESDKPAVSPSSEKAPGLDQDQDRGTGHGTLDCRPTKIEEGADQTITAPSTPRKRRKRDYLASGFKKCGTVLMYTGGTVVIVVVAAVAFGVGVALVPVRLAADVVIFVLSPVVCCMTCFLE